MLFTSRYIPIVCLGVLIGILLICLCDLVGEWICNKFFPDKHSDQMILDTCDPDVVQLVSEIDSLFSDCEDYDREDLTDE